MTITSVSGQVSISIIYKKLPLGKYKGALESKRFRAGTPQVYKRVSQAQRFYLGSSRLRRANPNLSSG